MRLWTLSVCFCAFLCLNVTCDDSGAFNSATEHPGGIITEGTQVLYKSKSPYWVRNDIIVERNAQLVLEAGVNIRFEPMVGITVRGILTAEVNNKKIS